VSHEYWRAVLVFLVVVNQLIWPKLMEAVVQVATLGFLAEMEEYVCWTLPSICCAEVSVLAVDVAKLLVF
jgi:hypothetical protein